jgi:hypothetical protein
VGRNFRAVVGPEGENTLGRLPREIVIVDRCGSSVMHGASPTFVGRLDGRQEIAMTVVAGFLNRLKPNCYRKFCICPVCGR